MSNGGGELGVSARLPRGQTTARLFGLRRKFWRIIKLTPMPRCVILAGVAWAEYLLVD